MMQRRHIIQLSVAAVIVTLATVFNKVSYAFVPAPSFSTTQQRGLAIYHPSCSTNNIISSISSRSKIISKIHRRNDALHRKMTSTSDDTIITTTTTSTSSTSAQQTRRILGSQELLMLPRQYGVSKDITFPSMNHVSCTILNVTPDRKILLQAVQYVMDMHPLLQSHVEGDGEPEKRIDLLQMVRSKGEPNPLTFVVQNESNKFDASKDVVTFIDTATDDESFRQSWQSAFQRDLDDGSWCKVQQGPLWKLEVHAINGERNNNKDSPCALLFSFNHAISDQSSANRLVDQIVRTIARIEKDGSKLIPQPMERMPFSMEESVLGMNQCWNDIETAGISFNTAQYILGKATEGLQNPVILPDSSSKDTDNSNPFVGALTIMSGREAGGKDTLTKQRKSTVQFRTLSSAATSALLTKCRENGVTISNALTAAMTYTVTDFIGTKKKRNYKILQSLDMRRFGAQLDRGTTVACMAGSHDLMHGPLEDGSGKDLRSNPTTTNLSKFWKLALDGKQQTEKFISNDSKGPKEAVRVFDFAMSISDLNNLVYLTSQSQHTKGRAYSAGVTNAGVYEKQTAFGSSNDMIDDNKQRQEQQGASSSTNRIQHQHGRYKVDAVYYATPHTQSGCLYPMSCMTIDGKLHFTFNPVDPIVDEEANSKFADSFIELLETVTETRQKSTAPSEGLTSSTNIPSQVLEHWLPLSAAIIGFVAVASHGGAWIDFFRSVMEMKANFADPADFWAALNFWIFFAVGHPILPPILWISDVLHGSPGPKIADLVPVIFVVGNLIAIAAVTLSKEIRNAVNIAALAAFFTYVGAGLDGTAGLGDFNLALDDSYKGQVVKGCPAYEDVRQSSMDGFDLKKYQGLWYEHKFHDWTQFKEVYDTTLDIRLTEGGLGWVDDFAVKGPAPDAARLSWDKSPVANGAHYFLFGRVDPSDPPGILREKGFGVEFPNYIVDVLKDPKTGEYTEAIQFQCLERGGVRIFEGINFMSRNPEMSDVELEVMHLRAEKAGMYPYGASPEQMHRVARRPIDAPPLDNNWQAMWRAIGVDKLLELLTQSIEDGGR